MINPSAHGWVKKFFYEQQSQKMYDLYNCENYYVATRKTGFLVGYSTHFVTQKPIEITHLTLEEISKIALLNTLYGIYQLVKKNNNSVLFLEHCVSFYKQIHPKESGFLDIFLPNEIAESKLEKIIANRIKTNNNAISKNFSHIIINALLFIDVLAFKQYLEKETVPDKYLKKIEEIIVCTVAMALATKQNKSYYDNLLQKLFENSVRYSKFNETYKNALEKGIDYEYLSDDYEKFYVLDINNMALWTDGQMETIEAQYLKTISKKLQLTETFVNQSIQDMNAFLQLNKASISYFKYSNPVKHFYDQTTTNIQILVNRNKKRLLTEISQSKELMILLSQSTHRELNSDEKRKVKTQILDICKTIPSLTIFLLPGGSLLLPLLIKFIPKLLPSAFNENLDNTK